MTPNPQPSNMPQPRAVAGRDIFDELSPPQTFVMCPPRYLSTRIPNNVFMKEQQEVNVPRAMRQFARAQHIFEALDVEVLLIPPVPGCQDQCFTLDTKISLLDGTEKSFKELLTHEGEIWVYSYDRATQRIVPGKASKPFKTGSDVPVLKVTLDNGEVVRCTPSHRWLMRDGTYKRAGELKPHDSLMPLYRKLAEDDCPGYEQFLDPATDEWVFTHRRVCEFVNQSAILDSNKDLQIVDGRYGDARHHLNFNERDNRPDNLAWINFAAHRTYHASLNHKRWSNPDFRARMAAKTAKQWENPEYREKMCRISSETLKRTHRDPIFAAQHSAKQRILLTELNQNPEFIAARDRRASEQFKRLRPLQAEDPEWRAKQSAGASRAMTTLHNDPEFAAAHSERAKRRNQTPCSCKTCGEIFPGLAHMASHVRFTHNAPVNHKVVSIEPDGTEDVYDITVEDYHNFALSAGVFVHNCYVANIGIAIEPYIVLANYKAPGRDCEVEPARQFFESMGYQCIQPPFHFEGEADLKKLDDKTYFGGWGQFSDPKAHEWIAKQTGVNIIPVHEVSEQLYHLDCSLLFVDEQHALVTEEGLDAASIKALEKYVDVTMTPRGKGLVSTGITNAVLIPEKKIICSGAFNPELPEYRKAMDWMNKTFDQFGYTCVFLDVDEFDKSGADLSCSVFHLTFEPQTEGNNESNR